MFLCLSSHISATINSSVSSIAPSHGCSPWLKIESLRISPCQLPRALVLSSDEKQLHSNPSWKIESIRGSKLVCQRSKRFAHFHVELVLGTQGVARVRGSVSSSNIVERINKALRVILIRRSRSQLSAEEASPSIEQISNQDSASESPTEVVENLRYEGSQRSLAGNAQSSSQTFATVVSSDSAFGWKDFPKASGTFTQLLFAFLVAWSVVGVALKRINEKFRKSYPRRKFRSNKTSDEESFRLPNARSVFQAPSAFSLFLENDFKRKESVEWVNMVLGKLWKVYRLGLEDWLVGLLQPLIDNLKKPGYVKRVQIKQFYLGDEPLSVRSVERRTSRRAHDLQYHIGLRYTGGARMLLSIFLKVGILTLTIPVGVRGLDVDGELWVKLRLVPSEPWVGTATWAFVSLPKITMALAPFGLFNLMAIPFLSAFLTKLLTEDLPQLFVRPNKKVLNFMRGRALGPAPKDFKAGAGSEFNKDFSGELSVTVIDARKLNYIPIGKPDPYVVLMLGDQVIRSKRNSQTSVFGPPGAPIWNQDFQLLVVNPKMQRLTVCVRDTFGLTAFTVGRAEVDLSTLQDTVPCDKIVTLKGGLDPFLKRYAGDVVLRLTYKAYVEDEEEDIEEDGPFSIQDSDLNVGKMELNSLLQGKANRSVDTDENGSSGNFLSNLLAAISLAADDQGLSNGYKTYPKFFDQLEVASGTEQKESGSAVVSRGLPLVEGNDYESKGVASKPVAWWKSPEVAWLCLATGVAVLVAWDLNLSNFFNP